MKIINEGQGHLKEYMDGVKFKAVKSKYDNCACEGCFKTARVVKITCPYSLYHDGKKLSTKYYEKWLCDECLEKLKAAISAPGEEK